MLVGFVIFCMALTNISISRGDQDMDGMSHSCHVCLCCLIWSLIQAIHTDDTNFNTGVEQFDTIEMDAIENHYYDNNIVPNLTFFKFK